MTTGTFAEFVRTATRPVLTVIGLLAWILFIEAGITPPIEFRVLVGGMVAEWFGERMLSRMVGTLRNG